jgi:hypothetical protein
LLQEVECAHLAVVVGGVSQLRREPPSELSIARVAVRHGRERRRDTPGCRLVARLALEAPRDDRRERQVRVAHATGLASLHLHDAGEEAVARVQRPRAGTAQNRARVESHIRSHDRLGPRALGQRGAARELADAAVEDRVCRVKALDPWVQRDRAAYRSLEGHGQVVVPLSGRVLGFDAQGGRPRRDGGVGEPEGPEVAGLHGHVLLHQKTVERERPRLPARHALHFERAAQMWPEARRPDSSHCPQADAE